MTEVSKARSALASMTRGPLPWATLAGLVLGYAFPLVWLRDRIELRRRLTFTALPFMLDLITLCVESGLNVNSAIAQAVAKGPSGPLRDEFARLMRDMRPLVRLPPATDRWMRSMRRLTLRSSRHSVGGQTCLSTRFVPSPKVKMRRDRSP